MTLYKQLSPFPTRSPLFGRTRVLRLFAGLSTAPTYSFATANTTGIFLGSDGLPHLAVSGVDVGPIGSRSTDRISLYVAGM